mmetsp:Transcript_43349/g.53224  ORF Transcript_43349/g.53224 Transcript_43349/m.53224 type:complete len:394 (-) Transcript_43349:93-1274(-)
MSVEICKNGWQCQYCGFINVTKNNECKICNNINSDSIRINDKYKGFKSKINKLLQENIDLKKGNKQLNDINNKLNKELHAWATLCDGLKTQNDELLKKMNSLQNQVNYLSLNKKIQYPRIKPEISKHAKQYCNKMKTILNELNHGISKHGRNMVITPQSGNDNKISLYDVEAKTQILKECINIIETTRDENKKNLNSLKSSAVIYERQYGRMNKKVNQQYYKIEALKQSYNESINKYNDTGKILQIYWMDLDKMKIIDSKNNELYNYCAKLIKKYAHFMHKNKCKVKDIPSNLKQELNNFEKNWIKWNENDLVIWLKYKLVNDNLNDINWDDIEKSLKRVNIKGCNIDLLANNSRYIQHVGINDIKIAVKIQEYIKELINKFPPKNNDVNEFE